MKACWLSRSRNLQIIWKMLLCCISAAGMACRQNTPSSSSPLALSVLDGVGIGPADSTKFLALLDSGLSEEARVLLRSESRILGMSRYQVGEAPPIFSLEADFSADWKAFRAYQVAFGNPFALGGGQWRFGRAFVNGSRILIVASEGVISIEKRDLPPKYVAPLAPPGIFSWLLQSGKVPGSERVVWGSLWSQPSPLPVFTAQYRCGDELAWVLICPGGDLVRDFSSLLEKMEYSKREQPMGEMGLYSGDYLGIPLKFAHLEQGWTAIEGCHDPDWTLQKLMAQADVLPMGAASLFLKKNAISN